MSDQVLIVDALSAGVGRRTSSRDSIGCGPRAVAGVLEKQKVQCKIQRMEDVLVIPKRLRRYNHVAISAMTMDLPAAVKFAKIWKHERPHGRMIIGGPIAFNPKPVLESLKPDLLVMGEGEATLENLLEQDFFSENIDLSKIDGIAYLDHDDLFLTPSRSFITSEEWSNDYKASTERIVDYKDYQAARVYVEVLRGCSNFGRTTLPLPDGRECTNCGNCQSSNMNERLECPENIPPGCGFCSVPNTWGPPRSRSAASIVNEIEELVASGVHRIVLEAPDFLDYQRGESPVTNPCAPPANNDAIASLLDDLNAIPEINSGNVHLSIENIKACLFADEIAGVLTKRLTSISPNIGLETGSDIHMAQIGKCGSASDVVNAVKTAKKHGMFPYIYFIYGLPSETAESVQASVKIMHEVSDAGAERIILYGFRPLPESAFSHFSESSFHDPLSEPLRKTASRINRNKKDRYLGKTLCGIAAEPSWSRHGYTIVYPFGEGPIMTVRGGYSAGSLLMLKITKVLSPGLLEAEVVK
ncbi:MAG: radical SAM protein [Candidatus Thorarchaeota archaeon]|nr:radical SAM protein [Candidatus Thorarchaeota archaeon]